MNLDQFIIVSCLVGLVLCWIVERWTAKNVYAKYKEQKAFMKPKKKKAVM
jgi:hypothetical protein